MLTTENLHLYYGQKEALKGIDLAFEAQTMTASLAPAGVVNQLYCGVLTA